MSHWFFTIVAIIMIGYGAFLIISPKKAWDLFEGKSFKGKEPKRAGLASTIFTGISFIVIALIILFNLHF